MTVSPRSYLRRRLLVATVAVMIVLGLVQLLFPAALSPARRALSAVDGSSSRLFAGQLLVYGRHGFTDGEVDRLRTAVRGHLTPVYGGEVAFASGRAGFPELPLQTFTVDAAAYARAANRPALAQQLEAGLVLSRRSAGLRRARVGGDLQLADGRRLQVSAIVDDALIGGYEAATTVARLGHRAGALASYLLVDARHRTAERLRAALPDRDLRIESRTRNGFLSSADSVLTQAEIKSRFGEFALAVDATGALHEDPSWKQTWLTSTSITQLGAVTCNVAVIAPLRAAMEEVTRRGLGALVHTADFQREGGCWSPRVARFGAGQLSAHAWGIAVDINVDVNPLGAVPRQDPRLVDIMARHGFTWGGRFLRPDGAHFEWVGAIARGS
jgi:hypothetical protein